MSEKHIAIRKGKMIFKLFIGATCTCLTVVSLAKAATLNVDGGGILLGASGVDVGGTLYDVEFVGGSCIGLFDSCDSVLDFDFITQEDAENAAQALLDQVFIDGTSGNFDSLPDLTKGCAGVIGGNQVCTIETPFGMHPTDTQFFWGARAVNWAPPDTDNVNSNFTSKSFDVSNFPVMSYAKWTPAVPVPAAVWLFGSGLIGLVGFSRRKKA